MPSEPTLNSVARVLQVATLPLWSLCLIGFAYYTMVTDLSVTYGWLITELQAWESPLSWIGGGALALAFWGSSLLVLKMWKRAAIARYREDDARTAIGMALAVTLAALTIDFAASFMLLNASIRESFLGLSMIPQLVVWLMAGLTTLAQVLGSFYGWNLGLRHEVATAWWDRVTRERESELDELRCAAFALERRGKEDQIERRNLRPRAHVASGR